MKKLTFLLLALLVVSIFNINARSQSVPNIFPNQNNHLTGHNSFKCNTKVNECFPVGYNLTGMIRYENEMLLKAIDDDGPVLDSIVVESLDENNYWIKDGIYKYDIEKEGNRINYKIYFLDEFTNVWTGFLWRAYEYDEQGRLIWNVFYESVLINVKERKLFYSSKTEQSYNYDNGKRVEKISYKRDLTLGELIPVRKVVQVFDANDNLLKEEIFSWKSNDENWFRFKEFEYAYDENGYQILTSEKSWDSFSGVEIGWKRMEFEFDEEGNMLTEINYLWNGDSVSWNFFSMSEWIYKENGELNNKIGYRWNLTENRWDQSYKEDFGYDSEGNKIYEKKSLWGIVQNDWVNYQLLEYNYDVNGNRVFFAYNTWNLEINDWVPVSKEENLFDDFSNQTLRSYYNWANEENTWIGNEKFEYGFDENGKKLFESKYEWNEESNSWVGNRKEVYVYDEYGNITNAGLYEWNNAGGDWHFIEEQPLYKYEYNSNGRILTKENLKFKGKSEYAYDEAGRYTLQKDFVWDQTIDDWRLSVMYEYGYDNEGRMVLMGNLNWLQYGDLYYGSRRELQYMETGQIIMESNYSWDNDAKEWVGYFKKEIVYYQGVYKSIVYAKWEAGINDWQDYLSETYYYSNEIIQEAIERNTLENLRIYPNPAENYIRVQLPNPVVPAKLEFFNMNGKKMLSVTVFQDEQVALNNFTPGIYTFRIIQQQKIFSGKIVKK
jgi:hypothetical protein